MTTISKSAKAIIDGLSSSDPKKVIENIEKSRKEGNLATFKALLNTLKETDEPDVEAAIIAFLYDLKDEESIPLLIEAIEDPEMNYYQSFLVATFWQSAIDGADYLSVFVNVALKGEYMTALEALTVIENFDSSFSSSEIMELEADLAEAIEEEEEENKKALLISMQEVVRNLPLMEE